MNGDALVIITKLYTIGKDNVIKNLAKQLSCNVSTPENNLRGHTSMATSIYDAAMPLRAKANSVSALKG